MMYERADGTVGGQGESETIAPHDLIVLLEDGPQSTGLLAKWLKQSHSRVLAACRALARARRIQCLAAPDRRWALPTYDSSVSTRHQATDVEDFEFGEDDDAVSLRSVAKPKPLRQLSKHKGKAEDAPSWWLTASRDGFTARATTEQGRMAGHRVSAYVRGIPRDYGAVERRVDGPTD